MVNIGEGGSEGKEGAEENGGGGTVRVGEKTRKGSGRGLSGNTKWWGNMKRDKGRGR